MDKKKLFAGFLVLWFILSASYLSWGLSKRMSESIFLRGYLTAVGDVIEKAENEECLPFSVFSNDGTGVELINVGCLWIPEEDEEIE